MKANKKNDMKELPLSFNELKTPSNYELIIQGLQQLVYKIYRDRSRAKNKKQLTQLEYKALAVQELIQDVREKIALQQYKK